MPCHVYVVWGGLAAFQDFAQAQAFSRPSAWLLTPAAQYNAHAMHTDAKGRLMCREIHSHTNDTTVTRAMCECECESFVSRGPDLIPV